jgi:hypothetical protein
VVRRSWCLLLVLALVVPTAAAAGDDPELARGIQAVDDGDYDVGIITLDGVVRRLAREGNRTADLAQAYLHLGIAYLAKGHETSARAKFRDALQQARDLTLSPQEFAPKVIELFEKAREEVGPAPAVAAAPAARPSPAAAAVAERRGGSRTPLLLGLGAAAAAGVALAAGGGGSSTGAPPAGSARETSFPNESMAVGAGKDFVVNVTGTGTLTATVTWQPTGVLLDMYIVALSNPQQVLTNAGRTGTTEAQLSLPVTAQAYRVSVTNSSGQGLQEPSTFTLRVVHP